MIIRTKRNEDHPALVRWAIEWQARDLPRRRIKVGIWRGRAGLELVEMVW